MQKKLTGAEIRQSYIDFFIERGHTFVPSSPLVPGGDFDPAFYKRRYGSVQRCFPGHRSTPLHPSG